MIFNLHCSKANNVGDAFSTPTKYFDLGKVKVLDLHTMNVPNLNYPVIIGGGGLFNGKVDAHWIPKLERLAIAPNKVVVWGVGVCEDDATIPSFVNKYDLVGLRDFNAGFEFVPCVSCMHPAFDYNYAEPIYDVVVYEHKWYPLGLHGYPTMTNKANTMVPVLQFLSSGKRVITNSYHGLYWAMLLGKEVVGVSKFPKFKTFKHQPIVVDTLEQALTVRDIPTFDILEEYREINTQFYNKVKDLILK